MSAIAIAIVTVDAGGNTPPALRIAMLDQPMIGRSIERAGAGRTLPKSSSPERLAAAVTELLADERARTAARRLGERLRATDAAGAATDAVERLLGERAQRPSRAA